MYTDSDNSEDEGLEDYKTDGYHPVHIGEILLNRYVIMQKLGWGHFSTAWLAKDTKYDTYVAIKIQKSAKNYIEAAYDEVEILQELEKHNYEPKWIESVKHYWRDCPDKIKNGVERGHSQIVQLLNSFIHHGQNGKHFCMVFEIMGVTLLEIIKRYNYRGIPLPYVRIITKQILIGLDFLHRMCGIIHTDLKPENVLVCLTEAELKEIRESGYFDESRLKSKKIQKEKETETSTTTTANANAVNAVDSENADKKKLTNKQLRKRYQKFKKRQKKKLENKGMTKDEVDKALNEMLTKRKEETLKLQVETDVNTDNYKLEDLLDRPRIASEPKYKLNIDSNENEDEYDDNNDNENCSYEFEFFDYMKSLHLYTKERNRILSDPTYRKELMIRSKMIKEAKNDKEREIVLNTIHEKMSRRGPEIDFNIGVKICDVGNACWFNHHFSTKIQTRQYRSPEVLLGVNYNETADMWSLACMVFELVTGDFLFDPVKGREFMKNDDHLACFMRHLGKMPKNFALSGEDSNIYFNKKGKLKRIHNIQVTSIKDVLTKKYKMKAKEAEALQDFLLPMLEYSPEKRASARTMLEHPWLSMPPNFNYLMSEWELQKMNLIINTKEQNKQDEVDRTFNDDEDVYEDENELYEGDSEDNSDYEESEESFSGDDNPDKIIIPNYNNSFAHYGQFVNLSALDRANPQFD